MLAQMPGPGVPRREGLGQAEAEAHGRERIRRAYGSFLAVSGGGSNDVLISQIINKYMLFIKTWTTSS